MKSQAISFTDKFSQFSEAWSPRIIAEMNDVQFKLARVEGEFVWHSHTNTDEVFVVIEGEMIIQFRDRDVRLKKGEMCVVPRGVEHCPISETECKVLLIEPRGVVNTGDAPGDRTAPEDVWI